MTDLPPPTLYHRWLGWHAPAMRRALLVLGGGLLVAVMLLWFVAWWLAVIGGWDVAALTFLATVWPLLLRADGPRTERLASREDETNSSATVLLGSGSLVSLLGVGLALGIARHSAGGGRPLLISVAVLTVALSWIVMNTVYTLRYAHLHYASKNGGVDFGGPAGERPGYRDFAYVAFTIGMTYQVSDTAVRDPRIRRTVMSHAILSYVFGVVIVAGSVNLIAGLVG